MTKLSACLSFLPLLANRKGRFKRLESSCQLRLQQQRFKVSPTETKCNLHTIHSCKAEDDQKQQPQQHSFLDPSNSYLNQHSTKPNDLPASLKGLDPTTNRFHQPIVYHPQYSFFESWPDSHTFPMSKFYHTAKALLTKQPQLPRPLVRNEHDFYVPLNVDRIPEAWIAKPHGPIDEKFLHAFLSGQLTYEEQRMIGFRELCSLPELITRTLLEVSGTVLTSSLAYQYGLATNVAGGTHHAHSTMGAGYTILNDLAISANYVMDERLNCGSIQNVKKVLIVDCDVHQGDGTAKFNLFEDNDEKEMITLSLHCQSNYPSYKANSTYDIGLPDKMRDEEYLQTLEESVDRAFDETNPDFVIYDAGVDVYEHDVLGRLRITEEGIRKRDRWVIERCVELGIPVAGVVGGGYDKDVQALARRHAILHEEASFVWRKYNMWKR